VNGDGEEKRKKEDESLVTTSARSNTSGFPTTQIAFSKAASDRKVSRAMFRVVTFQSETSRGLSIAS